MAALDFPSSPTTGDEYSANGKTWKWNGTTWQTVVITNITTKGLYENASTISADYTIATGNNAMSTGPITVDSGVTVTVPSGSRWVVL